MIEQSSLGSDESRQARLVGAEVLSQFSSDGKPWLPHTPAEAVRDPEVDLCRKREIRRLWRVSCEGCGLNQWIPTPLGFTVAVPAIGTITLGAPTVMTVQLRSTQRIEHIQTAAPEIAATMGIGELRVTPFRGSWVLVELYAASLPARPVATPKPDEQVAFRPPRRRGPSKAWTSRRHVRRWRRPEQPS